MPPAKKQNVIPREGGSVNFRTEMGGLEWHGSMPDGDPSTVPQGRLIRGINIRFRRGRVVPRKGQRRLNETFIHAATAKVRGIVDFQVGTRRSLYVTGTGCPNLSLSSGFYLGYADQDLESFFAPLVYYDFGTQGLVMGRFAGSLYLGQDNNVRKLQLVDAPFGKPPLAQSGSAQDVPLYTFTGFTKISAMTEDDFSGYLFMGVDNGAASKITVHDGLTFIDDLTGIRPPTCFFKWRDKLIAGFAAVADHIRIRDEGNAPGTWTTVAPAGSDTINAIAGVSYRDDGYLIDGTTENVWKYSGTTLNPTHALPATALLKDICVFDGYLFVAYTIGTTPNARIARYDGVTNTWVDVHKDLTAQDPLVTDIGTLEGYRDSLWAGLVKGGTGTQAYSPQYTTSGTWTVRAGLSLTNISRSMVY